jgi:hypothetical protein
MLKFKKYRTKIVLGSGAVLLCLLSFLAGRLSTVPASPEVEVSAGPEPEKISLSLEKIDDSTLTGTITGNAFLKINNETIDNANFEAATGSLLTVYNELVEITTPLGIATFEAGSATAAGLKPTGAEYVSSKNGTKYHPIDSGSAKQIKDENKVYFKSKAEAEAAGYEAGKSVK